ncbi:hypothetical protein QQ73_14180 [Candidatus Endoriftia persephone str. Guaymas]|jgi:uncharacterized protein (DUF302 family)|uniref:DUF302 domain-containing protein n=4 Tax=Gammaproteobacteria TaxID=1236 RepID=G2FDL2_9GAMM|nr:hypothetical protein [Candidatus Endoriftia persephone]MBA1332207.1 hypothetical protein [Candidatus Endoriftia persephone str. Guaymas]EGV49990.1 hypothetical protein Rifp1Sym_eq00040 [endosymbiont of Riftia pachyptila (vent Ph05)]EGW55067.1 hypothetical protein TevJSym_af00320 [endosymbiont of Tevnia jerichonana (vent Tica)]KRT53602.1 hypothetical protein Ga0074115_10636 [endosymbiont of Ridgeia piscesae]KRT60294.1 hypothetical protein Ga0076813_169212 [endosymbiont of Ridgeia piscesae]
MRVILAWMILLMPLLASAGGEAPAAAGAVQIYKSDEAYEDVIDNIKMAIEERGMLVSGTLHVSDMLNRTGPDLGYKDVFKKAESVEFCSAVISHKMTQVTPENLVICPFTIAVYIKAAEPEQVYVAFRRQYLAGDSGKVTQEIFELLDGIVKDSIE